MHRDYNIAWEVTEDCNHNCFYCYNFWRENPTPNNSRCAHTDYAKITDKLLALHPVSVSISGGEPLIVFDEIKESITYFRKNGIFVRILSNGSLVTEEIASFLSKYRIQVMVSFPTSDSEQFFDITKKNNFENLLRGLDLLKKHNVDTLVNVVISTANINNLEETADFLIRRYGYRTLYLSRATKPQNASAELQRKMLDNDELQNFFDTCLKIKKRYKIDVRTCGGYAYCSIKNKKAFPIFAKGCGGGGNSFVISNDGGLRVCGKDSEIFGNIFETDVDKIMDKANFWTDKTSIPKECIQCRYSRQCRGGCHMSSHDNHPKYNSLDFNADPIHSPIRLLRRKKYIFINPFRKYMLNETANYCKTENGNRFSNAFSFVYLSDELTKLLKGGVKISLLTVIHKSDLSFNESKRLFLLMLNRKIITEIN